MIIDHIYNAIEKQAILIRFKGREKKSIKSNNFIVEEHKQKEYQFESENVRRLKIIGNNVNGRYKWVIENRKLKWLEPENKY